MRAVGRLSSELEQMRAIARGLSRKTDWPVVEGQELTLRDEPSGLRHYIGDQPVHAGNTVCILTGLGWMRCRYEWVFQRESPPVFYLGIPGSYDDAVLALPPGARLAWPRDVHPED